MKYIPNRKVFTVGAFAITSVLVQVGMASLALAADWSDTAVSVRIGNNFHEPYNQDGNDSSKTNDIGKVIYGLTHASGDKYGYNFFNVDMLQSNSKDPATSGFSKSTNSATGAQEAYVVLRRTFDIGKVMNKNMRSAGVRGYGITGGMDWNTKNDAGYQSKKRMLVLGPTIMLDVPGFLNVDLLLLKESNAPENTPRYSYKTHPMLNAAWGIPLGASIWTFSGYGQFIAAKGNNEFGGPTAAETHFDIQLMADVGSLMGVSKNTFQAGFEFEYWKNKFGNPTTSNVTFAPNGGTAGPGATAATPMLRVEYHF